MSKRYRTAAVIGAAAVAVFLWFAKAQAPEPVPRRPAARPAVPPAVVAPAQPREIHPPEPLALEIIKANDVRARRGTILIRFQGSPAPTVPPVRPPTRDRRQ
jgi:hypothetical protein